MLEGNTPETGSPESASTGPAAGRRFGASFAPPAPSNGMVGANQAGGSGREAPENRERQAFHAAFLEVGHGLRDRHLRTLDVPAAAGLGSVEQPGRWASRSR